MARFKTVLSSTLPPEQSFRLLANFESVADWDPGVRSAHRVDEGDIGVGSRFRVVATFGPRRVPLEYVVLEYDSPERIALEAVTGDFTSYDVISVRRAPGGSEVTYEALLRLHGFRRVFDPLLQAAFLVIGKRAEAGLREALNPGPAGA